MMVDATPASFTKQIKIQDSETTITTNDGTEVSDVVYSNYITSIVKLTYVEWNALNAASTLDDNTLYIVVG